MNTAVTGLIFDLDNTLLDRNATFFKVAESFYAEHLSGKTSVTREDAVAAMVRWDEDGYTNRATMLERWVTEWPETGLDVEAVIEWYRAAMARTWSRTTRSTISLPGSTSEECRGALSRTAQATSTSSAG